MTVGTDPSGGYAVYPALSEGIGTLIRNNSALRALVDFISIESGDSYEEIISITAAGTAWVGELSARPKTATPQLVKITTTLHELYASPTLSQRLADDAGTNMVDFLVNEVGISFSESEELVLFTGNGINKPLGLDSIPTEAIADSAGSRPWGSIEYVASGTSGAFNSATGFDAVKKLFYRLNSGYRKNSSWLCNSETALLLSSLKNGAGDYIWSEGNVTAGTPASLLGRPVVISEVCPNIAADAKALWIADWNAAFRGIERKDNKVLQDPYTDKPNLLIYVYRRFGLQLRNSNAIKCMEFSTT